MRIFHVQADQFRELEALPDAAPADGYLWVGSARAEFEHSVGLLQSALQRWTGGQLVDLHVSDLLNEHLPSHFDDTSWYELLVFRRLAAGPAQDGRPDDAPARGPISTKKALEAIDTSPVGFALFDKVLLTVHPADCQVRDFFAKRLLQQTQSTEPRNATRLPTSPADLMLRMVNHMVDRYLELRRVLTRQFDHVQQRLFNPRSSFHNWPMLLELRNAMHLLEDTCEDQRSAIIEWIDALDEWPAESDPAAQRERELLRVRSRDVLEHIERVLAHVRRLESSAETGVQIHFAAQSHRTNSIMRTLTVLTAIFLPLNLVTGFFGMNFDGLPLIHSQTGFWIVSGLLLLLALGLSAFFWRKRYLSTSR
ncbi:MAG: magnesium transporter CorA family protein [Rhizobacter sp.]|nr:magnesium transporter CorA family protein [Rhizobacter sp.]